jgi:hypothetical protein
MQFTNRKPVWVRFDERESGWAVPLAHGLAMIANIPLSVRWNLWDIVTLEEEGDDGLPRVGQVIHRRFATKSMVHYHHSRDFGVLYTLLQMLGCETEGGRSPCEDRPGFLLVAHHRDVHPARLASALGIAQPHGAVKGETQ